MRLDETQSRFGRPPVPVIEPAQREQAYVHTSANLLILPRVNTTYVCIKVKHDIYYSQNYFLLSNNRNRVSVDSQFMVLDNTQLDTHTPGGTHPCPLRVLNPRSQQSNGCRLYVLDRTATEIGRYDYHHIIKLILVSYCKEPHRLFSTEICFLVSHY